MKRLTYDISRWVMWLHRNARGLELASSGDPPRQQLEDELFQRLLDDVGLLPEHKWHPEWGRWAAGIHEICSKIPDFGRLAAECHGDSDAAAVALEELLKLLEPALAAGPLDEPQLRSLVRTGSVRASAAVDELRDAVLGLEHVAPGTGGNGSPSGGPGNSNMISLARRLRDNPRLKRIATLAGRFSRILQQKRRSRVRPGVDEVTDVTLGGDLQRLLPTALGRLIHPKLRLLGLAELVERRALSYELSGLESLGKGPAIVLLDKSDSMNEGGKDEWATSVALALLSSAKVDRRTFALVPFNGGILGKYIIGPNDRLPEGALAIHPSGGTNISAAVATALEIVERGASGLGLADVVLVTDGDSDSSEASELKKRAATHGVTILGIAIEVPRANLTPWCDVVEEVRDLNTLDGALANAITAGVA